LPNNVELDSRACGGGLSGKKIILGVTGSVAAYKAAYIASALTKRGGDVHVVMTEHATRLVGPATFWSVTRNPVISEMFEPPTQAEITHVALPESADALVIAPATANIIGKLAYGIADDMLSTMALVVRCPVIIAPAMNVNMYTNPIVAANIEMLKGRGWVFVDAESGRLACGDEGIGRLAEPDRIVSVVDETLSGAGDYAGVSVLVTAGPTIEPIDPVRFISNRSSGKMGYAVAERAARRGAAVTLVSGPTSLAHPSVAEFVAVETVAEMCEAVKRRARDMDVLICAAAPADFSPAAVAQSKIKKSERLSLDLCRTPDILAEIGAAKGATTLVGFAAETDDLVANAGAKLRSKNLDLIVANDVSLGSGTFGGDTNQVTMISRIGETIELPRMAKTQVADAILDYVRTKLLEVKS